ncbi:MAG: hypothetical protein WC873_01905 [Candidatus Gracilibacteria bacterium]
MSEEEINKLRLLWRQELKGDLESLSSLDFQRKVWIENSIPGIWWDWAEAMCGYFDDLGMIYHEQTTRGGLDYHVKIGELTKAESKLLKPFNDLFDKYTRNTPTHPTTEEYEKILSDPEWIEITKLAAKILKQIDFDKLPKQTKITHAEITKRRPILKN